MSTPHSHPAHGLWPVHPQRARILGEVHARPFRLMKSPRVVLHYAFETPPGAVGTDRAFLSEFCRAHGVEGPGADRKFHSIDINGGTLRWEQFSEFTSYTFDCSPEPGARPFGGRVEDPFGVTFRPPGELVVAMRLDLVAEGSLHGGLNDAFACFEDIWVSASHVVDRTAMILTDFRVDRDGRTRILVVDRGMPARQVGALVQRLTEIETYRTFAMLGLPEAQAIGPTVNSIERRLVDLADEIRAPAGLERNKEMLAQLTTLTADLEAVAAASAYRFGASLAYHEIVGSRLAAIREEPYEGYATWAAFLDRRTAPAMRTLQSLQDRQHDLSQRLGRAANLLRTRVDVENEQQNRDALQAMNRRARVQLRLQQTVEGLSVAAVSYYVVGLVGYLAKGDHLFGIDIDPAVVTALAVLPVVAFVWLMVRVIRRSHGDHDADAPGH